VEGKELVQDSGKPIVSIFIGDPKWTDYDFEVEAMRTKGDDPFTLLFRRSSVDRMYAFRVGASGDGLHTLASYNPEVITPLADRKGDLQTGRWYTAKVKVRGDKGECYLDGVKIFEFKAGEHAAGSVGLETAESAYRFKNIKVTAPDGTILLQGMPEKLSN
jgi:hypothetical protein